MIELAELIRALRSELDTAVAAAPRDGLRLRLGEVELEVAVVIEQSGGAGTKMNFLVVEVGVDGKLARTTSNVIRLKLTPEHPDGPTHVAGRGRAREE
ncbi:trypco2 family protein [Catellatospora paridis]|uniref:trypco2 family protein n=1 Tax=Catellatospora paridis TaxID=1617086 RepID=UPI0012D42DE4|nr:trypco2 family protein [Catellatospora paridis]